jgi:hypothetical protein
MTPLLVIIRIGGSPLWDLPQASHLRRDSFWALGEVCPFSRAASTEPVDARTSTIRQE